AGCGGGFGRSWVRSWPRVGRGRFRRAATLAPAELVTRAAITRRRGLWSGLTGGFPAGGLTLSRARRGEGMSPPATPENHTMNEPKFPLGQVVTTPAALEAVDP